MNACTSSVNVSCAKFRNNGTEAKQCIDTTVDDALGSSDEQQLLFSARFFLKRVWWI